MTVEPRGGRTGSVEARGGDASVGEVQLRVRGMHCASCVSTVEKALAGVDGVAEVSVNLVEEVARVRWSPAAGGDGEPGRLESAVEDAGYGAEALSGTGAALEAARSRDAERDADYRDLMRRFWVGLACGVPVVAIGHWEMIPGLAPLEGQAQRTAWWLSALLTLPIVLYVGRRFYTGAWALARRRSANMDTLVALGTGAAWIFSTVAVALPGLFPAGSGRPFYEAVAAVITLVVLGQAIESRAKGRTSRALGALFDLAPETADRVAGDGTETVPVSEVSPGDLLLVRPGARVPIDGVVRRGVSEVDESMLSGESLPVARGPGDDVVGGAVNGTGALTVEATRVGADTMLARIVRMVQRAQGSKLPIQRTVDVVAGRFVPAVMLASAVTFAAWYAFGPVPALGFATVSAVSVLVIACPCALGLATPLSVMIAIGKAAAHGVLIRDGDALQRARRVDTVVMDKTGTLTLGRPEVSSAEASSGFRREDFIRLAAAVESLSEHPVARAVTGHARGLGLSLPRARHFAAHPGQGASGVVEGKRILVGSASFLAATGVGTEPLRERLKRIDDDGATPVAVAVDGVAVGTFGVADTVRPGARGAVERLQDAGVEIMMLTGDTEPAAQRVARRTGISRVRAGVSPGGKAEAVAALRKEGRVVAMVGDGINDAPALATADVGIAMGSGTDVALLTGEVALMGDSLRSVELLLRISRRTHRNIVQNLVGAFVYNVIGIPIAAGALYPALGLRLSPMIAGAAMALSSVTVVANAGRLRRFKPDWQPTDEPSRLSGGGGSALDSQAARGGADRRR